MSPNGRRAWREWVRRQNLRHKYKQPKGSVCRMARQARRHIPLVPNVTISLQTGGLSQTGFGTGMILGYSMTGWVERSRTYSSIAGVAADFAATTPEYKAANAYFAQMGVMLPKPLTARSLVGMTMGARKRAARLCLGCISTVLRSKYHIGERLRPCPGCPECEHGKCWRCANCGTTKGLCDLTLAEVRCKCGKGCGQWRISYPSTMVCDGSGVLPARKS